jgi:hypothetical protein
MAMHINRIPVAWEEKMQYRRNTTGRQAENGVSSQSYDNAYLSYAGTPKRNLFLQVL